jgi:2-methylaconitate cis-trans-isomerase PrpF
MIEGLVKSWLSLFLSVRIFNTNSRRIIVCPCPLKDGKRVNGDFEVQVFPDQGQGLI